MSESDFTVEVRDVGFVRLGQIAPEYTDLKFVDVHNGVGSWELKLPAEHPRLPDLKQKGSGIVVTEHWMEGAVHKYRTFSGRMRTARLSQNAADPAGTWVITGVDDNVIAAATRVYPDPLHAADAQEAAYWELSGPAETVMKNAVWRNAGSGAIAARVYPWLSVPSSTGLGDSVKCSSRFDVLGDLLTSLGTAGNLGWEFRQVGAGVTFSVYTPQDKTGAVRLDIRNGGLESNELGFTAPSASEVLVLGQGEGEARTVLRVSSAEAAAEVAAWGLRWEQVKDQRNTDDPVELQQAGDEIIAEQGATVNSLKVVPSDTPGMALGRDWYRGDKITVVVDGQETTAIVTQVATSISAAGIIRQVAVGDPVGFSFEAKIASKVKDVEQRVGQVERLIGQGVDWPDISNKPARVVPIGDFYEFVADTAADLPLGYLPANGQAVSRTAYPALFALYGTKYGAGNGTTTFNLPKFNSFDAQSQIMNPRMGGLSNYVGVRAAIVQDNTWPGTATQAGAWMNASDFGIHVGQPTAVDSYMALEADGAAAMQNGMRPGKTYVVAATGSVRTLVTGEGAAEAQTLVPALPNRPRARAITVFVLSGGVYKQASSPQIPNVVQTGGINEATATRVWLEFTVPADATQAFIRFYLGGTAGGITWARPTLIERTSPDQSIEDLTQWFHGYTKPTPSATFAWAAASETSYPIRYARNRPGTLVAVRAL
ncbi:minor tail protein [Microbacterium phage Stromboli]|uniref:minor tail protein n=1 Tax=Microbacterium phage Stromboli TaxID=2713263 RepID=UPI0014171109|nr:minor tail protein [Microbacterium phage Stromboli]QIN93677.1 minor tail protein [Microbacterium phage Stromboli]